MNNIGVGIHEKLIQMENESFSKEKVLELGSLVSENMNYINNSDIKSLSNIKNKIESLDSDDAEIQKIGKIIGSILHSVSSNYPALNSFPSELLDIFLRPFPNELLSHRTIDQVFLKKIDNPSFALRILEEQISELSINSIVFLACKSGNLLRELNLCPSKDAKPKNLNDEHIALIVKHCPNLEKLNLFLALEITDSSIHELSKLKNLKSLSLPSASKLSPKGWALIDNIKSLERLNVAANCQGDSSLRGLDNLFHMPNHKKLKEFKISTDMELVGPYLWQIVQEMPEIENLWIGLYGCAFGGSGRLNNKVISTCISQLEKLVNLSIISLDPHRFCVNTFDDNDMSALTKCQSLESIILNKLIIVTNEGIKKLKSLPNLKHLDIEARLVDSTVIKALEEFPKLESVKITDYLKEEEILNKTFNKVPY